MLINPKPKPMILDSSDEAARLVDGLKGWVSRTGRFYGDDERLARWDGCTHVTCDRCGAAVEKSHFRCGPCGNKDRAERWAKLPLVEWDGETPFCLDDSDHYFFDADSFYDWLFDQNEDGDEDDQRIRAEDVRLVLCDPVHYRPIDADYWYDDMPEDGDLPDDIAAALDALNAVIRAHKDPAAWFPGKQRIVMPTRTEG